MGDTENSHEDSCPTPKKSRFATLKAAQEAADQASRVLNKRLNPYVCPCGWHHLTSKSTSPDPMAGSKRPDDLLALDREAFEAFVREDVRGTLNETETASLRHSDVLLRWMTALEDMRATVRMQLEVRTSETSEASGQWRKKALVFHDVLNRRHRECRRLFNDRSPTGRGALPKDAKHAMRSLAGENAIQRLIASHSVEFNTYLVEEYEKLGVEAPKRVLRYTEQHGEGTEGEGENHA